MREKIIEYLRQRAILGKDKTKFIITFHDQDDRKMDLVDMVLDFLVEVEPDDSLLTRYMRHVIDCEGSSFTRHFGTRDGFTSEEIQKLQKIDRDYQDQIDKGIKL